MVRWAAAGKQAKTRTAARTEMQFFIAVRLLVFLSPSMAYAKYEFNLSFYSQYQA
jgi:hypothetical protein